MSTVRNCIVNKRSHVSYAAHTIRTLIKAERLLFNLSPLCSQMKQRENTSLACYFLTALYYNYTLNVCMYFMAAALGDPEQDKHTDGCMDLLYNYTIMSCSETEI